MFGAGDAVGSAVLEMVRLGAAVSASHHQTLEPFANPHWRRPAWRQWQIPPPG